MKINTENTLFANPQSRPEMFMYFIIVAGIIVVRHSLFLLISAPPMIL